MEAVFSLAETIRREIGIAEPLVADPKGQYWVAFDNLEVAIGHYQDYDYYIAVVGAIPEDLPPTEKEALYTTLLMATLFGQGTGEAQLGLDRKGKEVCLLQQLDPFFGEYEKKEAFERFVNDATVWKKKLAL